MKDLERQARRRAFMLIAIGVLLITIPLAASSIRVFKQNRIRRVTTQLAQEWIEGTGFNVSRVDVSGEQIDLIIYGSGERPRLSDLGNQIDTSFDDPLEMRLVILPSEREEYVTAGG